MGQKVNPKVIRIGQFITGVAVGMTTKNTKTTLLEDFKIRKSLLERLRPAGISEIEIERSINNLKNYGLCFKAGNGYRQRRNRA